jgi:hypothetical protein
MSVEKPAKHFSALGDPQCAGKVEHCLIDILVMRYAVCAAIVCVKSWDGIAPYGRDKLGWMQTFLRRPTAFPRANTSSASSC